MTPPVPHAHWGTMEVTCLEKGPGHVIQALISGEAILGHSDKPNPMTHSLNGERAPRQRQRQEFHSLKLLRARPGDVGPHPSSSDTKAER